MTIDVKHIKDEAARRAIYELDLATMDITTSLTVGTIPIADSVSSIVDSAIAVDGDGYTANFGTAGAEGFIGVLHNSGDLYFGSGDSSGPYLFTTSDSLTITSDAGFTITLDGNVATVGYVANSVGNALTAAGTNRATALVLAAQVNNITTAGASTGALLPAVATVGIGAAITIFNGGANAIKVYGEGSDTIDGTAGSTGVTLTNAKRCVYIAVAAATWISAQLGVVSA